VHAQTSPAVTGKWNRAFTHILRENDRSAWGNWTLSPTINAGAVGIIDPETGEFTHVHHLPRAELLSLAEAQNWSLQSSGVHRTESSINLLGGYTDPSTGRKVYQGTLVEWSFPQDSCLSTNGHLTGKTSVNGYADLINEQFEWLHKLAKNVGFATQDGIKQGFGVITQTRNCCGAINLGSLESNSTFQLTGSVGGVAAMTGAGTVEAGMKGSFRDFRSTKQFECRLFPTEKDTVGNEDIAISYEFASFDKRVLIPRWAGPLEGLNLVFVSHGSYQSTCTVNYKVPGDTKMHTDNVPLGAGLTRTISGLPLDAYDMEVVIELKAGNAFQFRFARPLDKWVNGQVTFDIGGWWPYRGQVSWRT